LKPPPPSFVKYFLRPNTDQSIDSLRSEFPIPHCPFPRNDPSSKARFSHSKFFSLAAKSSEKKVFAPLEPKLAAHVRDFRDNSFFPPNSATRFFDRVSCVRKDGKISALKFGGKAVAKAPDTRVGGYACRIEMYKNVVSQLARSAIVVAVVSCGIRLHAASATLAWDPSSSPNITGYTIRYGTTSGSYPSTLSAGTALSATVANLTVGTRYYFVVTARNASGLESDPSNEISYTPSSTLPNVVPTLDALSNRTINEEGACRRFR